MSPRWLRAGKMMGVSLLLPSTVFCSQEQQEWNSEANNLVDYYWPSRQRNVPTVHYPASMSRCLPPSHLHTELARDQKWAELTEHRAPHQQLDLSSDPLCSDPLVKSVTAKWVDKCIFMKIHITGFIQKYPYIVIALLYWLWYIGPLPLHDPVEHLCSCDSTLPESSHSLPPF